MNDTDRCELGVDYFVPGTPCTISGDPHYSLWNGARHDYQGAGDEGLYLYVSPCKGAHHGDIPFDIIGKHRSWKGAVQGLEYLILVLFGDDVDDDDDFHYLYFSASFQAVIAGANDVGPLFDDNVDSPFLVHFGSGSSVDIGARFKLYALSLALSLCVVLRRWH